MDEMVKTSPPVLEDRMDPEFEKYLENLWGADAEIYTLLHAADSLESARHEILAYIARAEWALLNAGVTEQVLWKSIQIDCLRVMKNILAPANERTVNSSALERLWKLARDGKGYSGCDVKPGFLVEFTNIFRGIAGKSCIYDGKKELPEYLGKRGREAAVARSKVLDELGETVLKHFEKYPSGLDAGLKRDRDKNRQRILEYFKGGEADWENHVWQIRNVIRDAETLSELIPLPEKQIAAVRTAVENGIPFGITPYYLSLMENKPDGKYDQAIRAQVLPPPDYVEMMAGNKVDREKVFDFMGEFDTSPVDLVTRRYPGIAIIKPFNTCSQICVYCQRNWEIDEVLAPDAGASKSDIEKALSWLDQHPAVGDVLITGGDPCVMTDSSLRKLLTALSEKEHIYRIRIGTRTPVVLPMRWTDDLVGLISEFRVPGRREIAIITHFEHPAEITPGAMTAVDKIRRAGIGVYNQEVFTLYNSRRFESSKLRRDLRLIGVEPYYNFNMKGKEETRLYQVPIARILQERKEEARLLPGLDRTDEPVFNVPRMGKNHLRAGQDHSLIMIMPDGSRVYEFHPWEKNIDFVPGYNYTDVPIFDYLRELGSTGEDIDDYSTIWYYF